MVLLLLAGESGDQGGADADIRHDLSEHRDLVREFLPVGTPSHPFQNTVGRVLDRHIDIMKDLGIIAHSFRDLPCDLLGITVHQADPLDTLDLRDLLQKFRQCLVSVKVRPVEGGLLRDKDHFPDPLVSERSRVRKDLLHRNASVAAPDRRDHAVSASLIAPFCDLEIAVIAAGRHNTLRIRSGPLVLILYQEFSARAGRLIPGQDLFQGPGDLSLRCGPDHRVHFRDFLKDLFLIALRHAARDDQSLETALCSSLSQCKDLVDALLLGVHDKAAGVDDRGVRLVLIVCERKTFVPQRTEHLL